MGDLLRVDSEPPAKSPLRVASSLEERPDLQDLRFGQLRVAVLFSPLLMGRGVATLRPTVCHIVRMGAGEEMGRIHTAGVVAGVADEQTLWVETTSQLKREAMSISMPPIRSSVAVSRTSARLLPLPTFVRLSDGDCRPEPRDVGFRWHTAMIQQRGTTRRLLA